MITGLSRASVALLLVAIMMPAHIALGAPSAQLPSCVVGDWRLDNPEATFRSLFASAGGIQLDGVSGDVVLSIRGDGSYEINYAQFTLDSSTSAGTSSFTLDGWIRGSFSEVQPGALVGSTTDSSVTMTSTVLGRSTTSEALSVDKEEGAPVDYDCGLGRLTFTFRTPGSGTDFSFSFIRA